MDRRTDHGRKISFFRLEDSDLRSFLSNIRFSTFHQKNVEFLLKLSFRGKESQECFQQRGWNNTTGFGVCTIFNFSLICWSFFFRQEKKNRDLLSDLFIHRRYGKNIEKAWYWMPLSQIVCCMYPIRGRHGIAGS